jgi:hypothetical protein
MPLSTHASITTNPTYASTLIPTLWAGKMNVKFYQNTCLSEVTNTDWEGEIKAMGDKVVINNIPDVTVSDYVAGTGLTYATPVPSKVEMNIDKAKSFSINVPDVYEVQAKPKLLGMYTDQGAIQSKIAIENDVFFASYNGGVAANKGATAGVKTGAYNLGTDAAPIAVAGSATALLNAILAMAAVLDEQNVPSEGRFLMLSPFDRMVLMNSDLKQVQITGDSASMLRTGKIGMIDRFNVYVSNLLPQGNLNRVVVSGLTDPATGGTNTSAKRRTVLAGHKSAITFASQFSKVEDLPNPNDFGRLVRGLNIYGSLVAKPEALALALVA